MFTTEALEAAAKMNSTERGGSGMMFAEREVGLLQRLELVLLPSFLRVVNSHL